MDGCISLGVGEPDFVTPEPFAKAAFQAVQEGRDPLHLELRPPAAPRSDRRPPRATLRRALRPPQRDHRDDRRLGGAAAGDARAARPGGRGPLARTRTTSPTSPASCSPAASSSRYRRTMEHEFRVSAADLEAKITPRTKAILIGYPSNPTGAQMTRDDLAEIADLAARRDLIVISDEIYDRLSYGIEHTCFSSLPGMKERTVLLGGFSKAYAMTGWRVGWVCAPPDILEAMMKIHQYIIMSAPTPSQYAALEAITNGEEYAHPVRVGVRRAAAPDGRRLARHRPHDVRAEGRVLLLPIRALDRPERHGVRRAAAGRREGGRNPGLSLRRDAAADTSACATRRRGRCSKKRWSASAASCSGCNAERKRVQYSL